MISCGQKRATTLCQHDLLLLGPEDISLRYVNAGHLPPMLVHRGVNGTFSVQRLEKEAPFSVCYQVAPTPGEARSVLATCW